MSEKQAKDDIVLKTVPFISNSAVTVGLSK